METICLFGADYQNSREVHAALRRLLRLPEYYGMNADALNDLLGEREPVQLWIAGYGAEETAATLRLISRVFADNGGDVELRHGPFSTWGTVFYGTNGIVAVNRGKIAVWVGTGPVKPTLEIRRKIEKC